MLRKKILYGNNRYPRRCPSKQHHRTVARKCPSAAEYIGNVFVLGLATLVGEVVDLQAANALNVLLEPFVNEEDGNQTQEILANDVQDIDVVDLLNGLL